MYDCQCECGVVRAIAAPKLLTGQTKSCGCWRRDWASTKNLTHGQSRGREYGSWRGIKERCLNPRSRAYTNYGGRGITMAPKWRDDFRRFVTDMGPCPPRHSIERIDNDGPYAPGNCLWVPQSVQARNKRNNVWVAIDGVRRCVAEWAAIQGLSPAAVSRRLKRGWHPAAALGLEPKPKRRYHLPSVRVAGPRVG